MKKLLLLVGTLCPSLAFAHGEHGATFIKNLWHVLTNPLHAWPLIIALMIAIVVAFTKARQ